MAIKEASREEYAYPGVGTIAKIITTRGGHHYELNGEKVPSPTDVLQPNAQAMTWYGYALGLTAAQNLVRQGTEIRDIDLDGIKELAKEAKLTPNHDTEARDIGAFVHNALELYAQGNDLPTECPPNCEIPMRATRAYLEAERPHILKSEVVVASAKYGYAGTLDAIVGRTVVDYKTSKAIYPTNHIQVAAYIQAARECGLDVEHGQLVHLDKQTGDYSLHACHAEIEDWACSLDQYNRAKLLEGRMKG